MTVTVPTPLETDSGKAQSSPDILWSHPLLCQFGLPLTAPATAWQRRLEESGLALEPGAREEQPLPSGWCLRLLLMHLCDQALRLGSPVVELGADPAALARSLGLPEIEQVLGEIAAQTENLAAAKLLVLQDGQAPLGLLDARGQSRRGAGEWRGKLRLSARFQAGLAAGAVALDRRIVLSLAAEPLALDAHGWIRHVLEGKPDEAMTTTPWAELQQRFGAPEQSPAEFRAAFEDALRMVFAVDFSIRLAADDAGVTVGRALAPPEPAPAEPPRPAAPRNPPPAEPAPRAAPRPAIPPTAAVAPTAVAPSAPPQPAAERGGERMPSNMVSLKPHVTGLPVVVWLKQGEAGAQPVLEVTPGARMDPGRTTLLMLEPLIMQVSGGLNQHEFDKVAAWAMVNRDLIDLYWDGRISGHDEIAEKVRKVPAGNWRYGGMS